MCDCVSKMTPSKNCLQFDEALVSRGLRVFSVLLLLQPFLVVEARHTIPKLTIQELGDVWKNVTVQGIKHPVFYSPEFGSDFEVVCEAPYPIQWTFTGSLSPADIMQMQPPTRNLVKKSFQIKVFIFFWEARNYSEARTSLQLSCEMIGNPEVKDDYFVFVQGGINKKSFIEPKILSIIDSKLIPCPTTDPTVKPMLYRKMQGAANSEELVQDPSITYNYVEGFRSDNFFHGEYECRQGSSSIYITAQKTNPDLITNEYHFNPKSDSIRVFSENTIRFECFSETRRPIKIVVREPTRNVTIVYKNTSNGMMAMLSSKNLTTGVINGTVVCLAPTASSGVRAGPVKTWYYEFVPTPELYLDNYMGEVHCFSNKQLKPTMIQTVRCRNGMHCTFMSHCFKNVTQCNYKKRKQFFSDQDSFCYQPKIQRGGFCNSVPYSHLNGLVQCKASGLLRIYLTDSDWREAPIAELVRMNETGPILYTNETNKFFCVAVAYLFADSLSFEIEYENGTRKFLEGNGNTVNISNPTEDHERKIDELNILGILEIMLPVNAVAIHCHAPWWNSTDTMITSRKFVTQHLLEPRFIEGSGSLKQETFYTGEKNRRLVCLATGQPKPEYTWYFNGKNVINGTGLNTSWGSNGESNLEFPELSDSKNSREKYSGEFKCLAINRVGMAEQTFKVNVEDEPLSAKSVVYIVSVVMILAILAVVSAFMYLFLKKYKEAQELVRSLTDNEIDEFFKGKPELLTNTTGNQLEVVDFLPYDTKYETPLDDLTFDTSEQNYLGSGEFSYVVRGQIISKNKTVAVKIFKTSADVTLFKSLLSEVKIMIYIGKHENVISLIGVCTTGIRNRVIHIATEICELGSLEVFLRKARPTFVDLMNANQELDMSLMPTTVQGTSNTVITTLDLINFSGQIAKGMEYLSFKSVIHADLAARNVLLTKDKVVKISDFGLSKKLYESNNYVKTSRTPLPWRWMSIEALTSLSFSHASDIWAYGVTLFEVFTLGDIPFPNEEWNKEYISRLASGMRMGRPNLALPEIYYKMVACWENEPANRPTFGVLREFVEGVLKKYPRNLSEHDNVKRLPPQYCNIEKNANEDAISDDQPIYANMP